MMAPDSKMVMRRAAAHRFVIHNRRHPAIGRDFQKVRSQLVAASDIDRLDFIGDAGFLEQDSNFFSVWGWPEV